MKLLMGNQIFVFYISYYFNVLYILFVFFFFFFFCVCVCAELIMSWFPFTEIGDYFYNYYRFGFDILFNGQQHIVKKIILHTNIPGCHEFGVYSKANFVFSPEKEFDLEKAKAKKGAFDCNERFDSREGMSEPLINDLGKEAMKFGPSLFYSYKGAVLEVFERNCRKEKRILCNACI